MSHHTSYSVLMLIWRSDKHGASTTTMSSCYAAGYQESSYQQGNAHDYSQEACHYYLSDHANIHIVLLCFQALSHKELWMVLSSLSRRREQAMLLENAETIRLVPDFDSPPPSKTDDAHPSRCYLLAGCGELHRRRHEITGVGSTPGIAHPPGLLQRPGLQSSHGSHSRSPRSNDVRLPC